MCVARLFPVLLLTLSVAAASRLRQRSDCRECPLPCQEVQRSDGSCPVCICGDIALADCPNEPVNCPPKCNIEFDFNGCRKCACPQHYSVGCPSLSLCPKKCQQLTSRSDCPECVCSTDERSCPTISCPQECTVEVGGDGCHRCNCEKTAVCPSMPTCLRRCISLHENSSCFYCNCTIVPNGPFKPFFRGSFPLNSFGSRPMGPEFFDYDLPFETEYFERYHPRLGPFNRHPYAGPGDIEGLSTRCHNQQRIFCPIGCRTAMDANGCHQCYCGDDAYICPGVQSCKSNCLFLSFEDGCGRCACPQQHSINEFGMIMGNDQGQHLTPPILTKPLFIHESFKGRPLLSSPKTPTLNQEKSCPLEPTTCDPRCQMLVGGNRCQQCKCAGILCPRVHCSVNCTQDVDTIGCPFCRCGSNHPQPSQSNNFKAVNSTNEPIEIQPTNATPFETEANTVDDLVTESISTTSRP
nr:uncharacterized protein LOC123759689 [Procambarus clarkii]